MKKLENKKLAFLPAEAESFTDSNNLDFDAREEVLSKLRELAASLKQCLTINQQRQESSLPNAELTRRALELKENIELINGAMLKVTATYATQEHTKQGIAAA